MEEVKVEISPSGEVKISVNGVKGSSCKSLTKNLELALSDEQQTKPTKEFYEHVQARVASRNKA